MILIYSHIISSRLQYICTFIFNELLGIDYELTIDSEVFIAHEGPKINYSDSTMDTGAFSITNHPILFEHEITNWPISCFTFHNNKAFFKTNPGDYPFDIFAASFYLLSRYEEYLPHEKDDYGRYAHENSLAFREGFLNLPLINIWVKDFSVALKEKFSSLGYFPEFPGTGFTFQPTYDIDIAYSYKYKGLIRNVGGFMKSPNAERLKVLAGAVKDPFDCYAWLNQLHEAKDLKPLYFFLVAEKNGRYDKNILPHKDAMWKLVRQHAKKYKVGLHPSWQSNFHKNLLAAEKQQLEAMAEMPVTSSRQHYIRFSLPEGYQQLLENEITDDYSMGYGSINGFRASVASSFYWYHLEKEMKTSLRVHPFCFMDANAFYEQQQSTEQTFEELVHYLSVCREINGTLITIWHNNFLGSDKNKSGWRALYDMFIARVQ